jgi:hypothetical protein
VQKRTFSSPSLYWTKKSVFENLFERRETASWRVSVRGTSKRPPERAEILSRSNNNPDDLEGRRRRDWAHGARPARLNVNQKRTLKL